jgi:hypothetical protein
VKRSGSVTAASVMLIVASVLVTFGAFFAVLTTALMQSVGPKLSAHAFARDLAGAVAVLLIAIWGIVTGVGLLRLRRWAWFCVLIISGLLVAAAVRALASAPKLIRATTGVPTVSAGNFVTFEYIGLAIATLVPLALGVWWLIAFLRPSARAQFAPGVILERNYPPVVFAPPVAPPSAPTPTIAEPIPHGSPRLQLSYRRPVSITVIAVLLLLNVAAFPVLLFYPAKWRVMAFFGFVLTGKAVLFVLAAFSVISLTLGVGLLRLKPWARVGAIVYALLLIVNVAVSSRAQMRAFQILQAAMHLPQTPGPQGQSFDHMFQSVMHISMFIGILFAVGINLAGIYFLATRGAAFQPPPVAPAPSTHAGLAQ